jgi:serine/threonine protein kinase
MAGPEAQADAMDPANSGFIGRVVADRYRILAKLGEGGMGSVYRAEQISLKRTVALKVLRPELSAEPGMVLRFNAEAELAAKLSHPNTVTLFDFGQDADGSLFIAMEYLEGQSLREVLSREGPLAPGRALAICEQLCASLADAHSRGIVHRDLKPDNVMLAQRGRLTDVVRVLDFGIAKLRDEQTDVVNRPMTRAGDLLGTPQYMAPEQIRGETVDARTDIYALGAMLYEMVTGRLPFEGPSVMAILSKHLTEAPVPPRERRPDLSISPALSQLIMEALDKDPARRPPTMDAFADRLARMVLEVGPGVSAPRPSPGGYPPAPALPDNPPPGVPLLRTPIPGAIQPAPIAATTPIPQGGRRAESSPLPGPGGYPSPPPGHVSPPPGHASPPPGPAGYAPPGHASPGSAGYASPPPGHASPPPGSAGYASPPPGPAGYASPPPGSAGFASPTPGPARYAAPTPGYGPPPGYAGQGAGGQPFSAPATSSPARASQRGVWIAAGVVVACAAGLALYFALRDDGGGAPPAPAPGPAVEPQQPAHQGDTVAPDFSVEPERKFYGDDSDPSAPAPLPPSTPTPTPAPGGASAGGWDGGWWRDPTGAIELDIPKGFTVTGAGSVANFAGDCGGAPCIIQAISSPTHGIEMDEAMIAQAVSQMPVASGHMGGPGKVRVQGRDRYSVVVDDTSQGMRGQLVVFAGPRAISVVIVQAPHAAFDHTAAFRKDFFEKRVRAR